MISAVAIAILSIVTLNVGARTPGILDQSMITIHGKDGKEIGLYDGSYALVVGVSDYTRGWPDLQGVAEDVVAVSATLEKKGFNVTRINNPTYRELNKAIQSFISQYGNKKDNRLLFYFAGHGYTVKRSWGQEMGYFVPADAPSPNENQYEFEETALAMQRINEYALRIDSNHAMFLFDSCFSGSLFAISRAIPQNISYKTTRPVRQFITSGSAGEEVPDKSLFRKVFIDALEGEGDINRDGFVTGNELGEYLQERVVNYSLGGQHPQYGKIRHPNLDKGDFVFSLGLSESSPPQPPPPLQPEHSLPRSVSTPFSLTSSRGMQPVITDDGAGFQLLLAAQEDLDVYCYYEQHDGETFRVFPNRFHPDPLLKAGSKLAIPDQDMKFNFTFERRATTELVQCFALPETQSMALPQSMLEADLEPMKGVGLGTIKTTFQQAIGEELIEKAQLIQID